MRLHKLYIDGFGHFRDQTMGPFDRNLTVLYGPNEAGKSTLLAFIRAILFGFPTRGRDEFYPPIAGGRHGGRITLIDDEGARYVLERFAGPHGGRYTLRNESGDRNGDPAALQRLTGHVTLDLFSNVFAFSLDEIQNEGLMNDSEVAGRLYSAGMGASGLPKLVEGLASRREDLFRPRGSAQKIAALLRQLEDVDDLLRAVRDNADQYHRLTAREDMILRDLEATEEKTSKLNARQTELGRLLEAWDDWVAVEGVEARLREMPEFQGFPDSPIERLEGLENRVRQAREDWEVAESGLRRISEAAWAAIPGENLLDDAERVEAIRRARTSFDGSVRDLPERQEELRQMEDALSDGIRRLGNGWDEASLDHIDTSLSVRQQVEVERERLKESAGNAEAAAIRLAQGRELLEEVRAEARRAQGKLVVDSSAGGSEGPRPASGHLEELLDDKEEVERIRRGRGSFDDSVRDLPDRRAELSAQEADFARQRRDLGHGWDESRLDGFDTSMVFRREVDGFRRILAEHDDHVRRSRERLENDNTELIERRAAVERAQARVPVEHPHLDAPEIEMRRAALRTARSRLNDHARASDNLKNLQAQLASLTVSSESGGSAFDSPSTLLPMLLGVAGIVLTLAAVAMGQELSILGIVAGVILLGFAAYLLFRGRGTLGSAATPIAGAVVKSVSDAKAAVEKSFELLMEAARPIGLDETPTTDSLDNAEADLEAASRALSTWDEANDRVEENNLTLRAQEKRVEEADKQARSAVEAKDSSGGQWRQWLERHKLDAGLTPETVMEFTGRIKTTRAVLGELRRMRHRVAAIEVDIDEYRQLVQPLAARHQIPLDEPSYQRIMAVADALIDSYDSVCLLVIQRDNALGSLGQQELAEVAAADEHRSASQALHDMQSEWRGWLRDSELNEGFTPETLLHFLARAETAHALRSETRRMRQRVAAIKVDIDQFRGQVRPLAEIHGITLDTTDSLQLATAADTLISRLEDVQKKVSEREQSRQQENQQRHHLAQLERRLGSAKGDFEALLAAGAAGDAEEFRRRAGVRARRQDLETQRTECLRNLSRLSGPEERLATFRESLAASDLAGLRDESRILTEQSDALNDRRDNLLEERGRNANEIRRLEGEKESSALRSRRNVLIEQLRENAQEWSRLTIAETILERTQKKFEQERQPSVIRHAEEFFSNVTGRRYRRLYAPVGERTITVTDTYGRDRRAGELSRGTREQLYLALRFGLIREFAEHAERLPVIVDEALVNFDAERATLAAGSFAKLSETNQVLVFTCHRAITDRFANEGARTIEIGRIDA